MAAKDELIAYGYELQGDGKYRRPNKRTQVWEPVDGGWLRFDDNGNGEEPEVYKLGDDYDGVAGLDKVRHPHAFEWLWPEEEVERIYAGALVPQQSE